MRGCLYFLCVILGVYVFNLNKMPLICSRKPMCFGCVKVKKKSQALLDLFFFEYFLETHRVTLVERRVLAENFENLQKHQMKRIILHKMRFNPCEMRLNIRHFTKLEF